MLKRVTFHETIFYILQQAEESKKKAVEQSRQMGLQGTMHRSYQRRRLEITSEDRISHYNIYSSADNQTNKKE